MSAGRLAWCWAWAVVSFALHNAEEWLGDLPAWSVAQPALPWSVPVESSAAFGLAVAMLTVAVALAGVVAVVTRASWSAETLSCFAIVLLINVVSHVALSLATWSLMPGVLTGVALLLPAALVILRVLPRVRLNLPTTLWTAAAAVAATLGALWVAGAIAGAG
ncbi:hypothetical protein AHOG_20435 [Actinoalloteichus hoggarensis]|uniref:HXXEE domain-containing protein n=1 Tax=Actinoalloteichus hoggarensis TaxID=1470176 RepID=A0A221W7H7_9PSEU|nr:hypothetical protein AHOG_20435 [Actinoalloteichus hoggarensis]